MTLSDLRFCALIPSVLFAGCDRGAGPQAGGSDHPKRPVVEASALEAGKAEARNASETARNVMAEESELVRIGDGSRRHNILQNAVHTYSPEDLCRLLVERQDAISESDLKKLSDLTYQLSLLGADGLVEGMLKVRQPWMLGYFYTALDWHLGSLPNRSAYREVVSKMHASEIRSGFLITHMANRMGTEPEAVMREFPSLREFNPNPEFNLWYNQLVADTFRRTQPEKVNDAWGHLDVIDDQGTRFIAAQGLFDAMYNADSIAATAWLDKLPDGVDKRAAVSGLVQYLTNTDDHESASAWKRLLDTPLEPVPGDPKK
jgi:hypothetical protein